MLFPGQAKSDDKLGFWRILTIANILFVGSSKHQVIFKKPHLIGSLQAIP
jgi:hypothetical protein